MTLRDKAKNKLSNDNTLRNKLNSINSNKRVAVIYKDSIIAIGTSHDLLYKSSRRFIGLMNNTVKEIVEGVTLYLTI